MRREVQVAGREIKLFVVARVVRDVHLAVAPGDPAVRIDYHRGVVIDARRAPLEDRGDDRHLARGRGASECIGCRARNRLCQIEEPNVFRLARITRSEKLLQADDLRAAASRILDSRKRLVQVEPRIFRTAHLDQSDRDVIRLSSHQLF